MLPFLKTAQSIVIALCIQSTVAYGYDVEPVNLFGVDQAITVIAPWKMCRSDSAGFSAAAYHDSAWERADIGIPWNKSGSGQGIRWYRTNLFIPEQLDTLLPLTLALSPIVSASELYWDGCLIARNGIIGTSKYNPGKSGSSAQLVIVPSQLLNPGLHTIALRVANWHTRAGIFEAPPLAGYFLTVQAYLRMRELLILICTGIFLCTALFHLVMIYGRPRPLPYLLFGILCLSSSIHLIIESLVRIFPIDLTWYYRLALINDVPWFAMMVLLPVFMLFEFSVRWRVHATTMIALIAAAIIIPSRLINLAILPESWLGIFMVLNQIHIYLVTLFSLAIALWAVRMKKSGGISAGIGLIVLLTGITLTYFFAIPYGWALGFCGLILLLTVSLALQMAWQNRLRQQSQLQNARLELELLKKHIQPHFLLNSLNSIIGYIEENPPVAATLVQALADELRMLMQYSKLPVIALDDELSLCRVHLKVMGLRQDKFFSLTITGDTSADTIPPLILHTLVENGITHGYAEKNEGSFVFTRTTNDHAVIYTLWNDSTVSTALAYKTGSGTGLRYVTSRLDETFCGRWKMESGPVETGWLVTITIHRTA